jgi:DNA-directed RNA polymerase subunit RPC12/RpoP
MSRSDYYRPSEQQVRSIYRCTTCRGEQEFMSDQTVEGGRCPCGGRLTSAGESYPASSDDWDEERRPDGSWGRRQS